MVASSFGGGGVLLAVVVLLVVARLGYSASRARTQHPQNDGGPSWPRDAVDGDGPSRPTVAYRPATGAATPVVSGERIEDPVLDIEGLTVAYGAKVAVHDLSLQIARGEIFGLLGPNGAGKTSTLSAVEGLLKPRAGSVLLDGIDVARDPIAAKARMGVQLQATSFQTELSVRQIVRLFAGLYGVAMPEGDIAESLQRTGLGGEADRPFKQLSGGQQQRLALYVALIHDPVLLLLDEPTSGLDPQSRRQLWSRIERIRAEGGSILLTTHSMEEAQAVCDRVAIIDHGRVLTVDAPRELIDKHKDDPRVQAVAHGDVTLEDVFIGLTGSEIRD
ncbi:MAG TPA: ABC transporter ATP-binding protein [Acidimicrobiales bacterium]|nr:ABC transporter ATP-binding protein [Acidimicrobiales bacterium]